MKRRISYNYFINMTLTKKNKDKKSILIIDDDKFLLDMYSIKFRELGFDVEVAFGAVEALEKIRGGILPDAVLLDVIMPEIDGFDFLRTIKKENLLKDSKIIILSNVSQKENVEKGLNLGAHEYIVKAYFTPSEIVKKIDKIL